MFVRSKRLGDAIATRDAFAARSPPVRADQETIGYLADAYARAGDLDTSHDLLLEMRALRARVVDGDELAGLDDGVNDAAARSVSSPGGGGGASMSMRPPDAWTGRAIEVADANGRALRMEARETQYVGLHAPIAPLGAPMAPSFLRRVDAPGGELAAIAEQKRRAPPERFLRNFRRECRTQHVTQPAWLPPDPVLYRQKGTAFRNSPKQLKQRNRTTQFARNKGIRTKPILRTGARYEIEPALN